MGTLISVIMSTYNESEDYIRSSVSSILRQTLHDLELIIVIDNPENEAAVTVVNAFASEEEVYDPYDHEDDSFYVDVNNLKGSFVPVSKDLQAMIQYNISSGGSKYKGSGECWGYAENQILGLAVTGQIADADNSNISRLGHRRWLLNPDASIRFPLRIFSPSLFERSAV